MPDFIVLHTSTPDGVMKTWDELGRITADDAPAAFHAASQNAGMGVGDYLVLPLSDQLTATIKTTVTMGDGV